MTSKPIERPVRRRLPPEVRRAEIADSTMELIARKGYRALTFAEIAAAAGVTVQGVLHHFPTKDDLLIEILDRRDRVDLETFSPQDHDVNDVREFIAAVNVLVARNAARPILIQLYSVLSVEALSADHPAHAYFHDRYHRGVAAFEDLAKPWHDDPHEVGVQVLAALDGLQISWLRDPTINLADEWSRWASRYFAAELAK